MKLRYIIGAVLGTLLFVGCQKEGLVGKFNDLSVENSFLPISMDGGSAVLKISSADSWSFAKYNDSGNKDSNNKPIMVELPSWLTASTLSGAAGTTDVTFTAAATSGGREAELKIVSGDKSLFVRVRQGSLEATSATVKEIYEGPDGKTYRVKGTCTGIYNTQYGNWYLDDGSNGDKVLTIYGTLDKDGKTKNFASLGIEVGDVVTVEGPKTTYGSTIELVDVTVLKIEKALVKIVEAPEKAASKDGGDVTVTVAYKGSGVYPTVSNDAKDWLVYKSTEFKVGVPTIFEKSPADTAIVTFTLAANQAGARSGVVNFTSSTSAKNTTTVPVTISQEGSIVSVSVAQFLAAEVGDSQYRLTGVISKVVKAEYGNVNIKDFSGEVYVYGIGAKGDFEKLGLKEGDIVTLVGKRGEHSGTAQMIGGQYESHIPVAKKTVAELREMSDDKTTYYMVTGKVAHIEETNADWDITKSGKFHIKDETGSIYVYKVATGWAGPADQFGTLEVKEGDTITIIGYRTSYTKNDYKLLQIGGGVYISHESGEGGGGGEGGDTGSPVTITTSVTGFPTAYPTTETAYKLGSIDYYLMNVANYGNGIQFKKGGSYLANKTSFGKIVKIECVWQEGKDFRPENFTLTVGSAEKPTATAITPTTDATALTAVYTVTGTNGFFMMKNDSGNAGYWSSIKVYFEEVN